MRLLVSISASGVERAQHLKQAQEHLDRIARLAREALAAGLDKMTIRARSEDQPADPRQAPRRAARVRPKDMETLR